MWCWVDSRACCGSWCRVHGAVVWLSYPVVLTFQWFVYPVAACRFILELPGLVYLVLPVFGHFVLVYLVFAIFEPSVLVLGFPVCV